MRYLPLLALIPAVLFVVALIGACIGQLRQDWRDNQRYAAEGQRVRDNLEAGRIRALEHELLTGPFASHPAGCEQCKREGG